LKLSQLFCKKEKEEEKEKRGKKEGKEEKRVLGGRKNLEKNRGLRPQTPPPAEGALAPPDPPRLAVANPGIPAKSENLRNLFPAIFEPAVTVGESFPRPKRRSNFSSSTRTVLRVS